MQIDLFHNEKTRCAFVEAWIGQCSQLCVLGLVVCDYHSTVKCSCKRQALSNCYETVGAFVCGNPTCGTCRCTYHQNHP